MNFLSGLIGSTSSPHDQVIANDLKRLNSVKVGLGDQAIAYVRSGAGETVLSSLSTLCKANELEVCKPWIDQKSPTLQRRELFARAHPYDLALMQRYTEALCAASLAQPSAKSANRYASEEPAGSDSAPRSVRVFFSEAFRGLQQHHISWPRQAVNLEGKGLTLEVALQMVRVLGGEPVDFFDVLYVKEGPYANSGDMYRQAVTILPAVEANPGAVMAAAQRMPAAARTDLISNIAEWGAAKSGAFTEFLVTQAGDGSKAVREASVSALAPAPSEAVTAAALALLKSGDAEQRAGMVSLLARLGSPSALEALRAHRETEKTARVVTAIDTALSLGDATIKAWEQHLADYEVKPLFVQFGRALLRTTPEDGLKTMIEDRKGWLTDAFTIRGAATKLGYERGPALDGGFFNEYRKTFQSAGLAAVIEFTGNGLPEQNVPAALMMLRFEKAAGPGRFSGAVKLADVPPVLLSECWNDYHAMAAIAKYDAEWEKKSPW